uniref:RING-type domain-containing protein n=1 Tax=viral metagenome TaxID=1070528 RepID=A0A6C0K1X2_9ZZZZ
MYFFFLMENKMNRRDGHRYRRRPNDGSYAARAGGGGGGGGAHNILDLPEEQLRMLRQVQAGEKQGEIYLFPFDITPISDATRQKMRKYIQQQLIQGAVIPHRNPAQIGQSDTEKYEHPDAKIHWWLHVNIRNKKDFMVRKNVLAALWKYAPNFYPSLSSYNKMTQLVEDAVESIKEGKPPIDTIIVLSAQVPGAVEQITLSPNDVRQITNLVGQGITDPQVILRQIFPSQAQSVAALQTRTTIWRIIELGILRNPMGAERTIAELVDIVKLIPNDDCAICIESLSETPNDIEMLPNCGHFFHKTCIDQWKQQRGRYSNCPKCRAPITGPANTAAFIPDAPTASPFAGRNVSKYKDRGGSRRRITPPVQLPPPPPPPVQVPVQVPVTMSTQSITDLRMPQIISRTGLYFVFDFDHTLTYRHSGGKVVTDADYIGKYYEELHFLISLLRCFGEVFIISRSPRQALIYNLQTNRQFIPDIFDPSHVFGSSGREETGMPAGVWTEKKVAVLENMFQTYQPFSKKDIVFFDDEKDNVVKAEQAGFSIFHTDPARTGRPGPSFPEVTMQNIRILLDLLGKRFGVAPLLEKIIQSYNR